MNLRDEKESGFVIVFASGSIDAVTSPNLEKHLSAFVEEGETRLILDLTDVDYISSAGLKAILKTRQRLQKEGKLIVTRPQKWVAEVFRMAGFAAIVTIQDDLETAKREIME
jgi:anti-anti-sigma factor